MLIVQQCRFYWCGVLQCHSATFLFVKQLRYLQQLSRPRTLDGRCTSERSTLPKCVEESLPKDFSQFSKQDRVTSLPGFFSLQPTSADNFTEACSIVSVSNLNSCNMLTKFSSNSLQDKIMIKLPEVSHQKNYIDMIFTLLCKRQLLEALNVLEVTMLKEDCVEPEYYIYTILINYCGLFGYPDTAFKLYADMMRRGLLVEQSVYYSLFQSVGNCPTPIGLQGISSLLAYMEKKHIEPERRTCWAILKAFAFCGSIEDGIKVLDYMVHKNMLVPPNVVSYLFYACAKDNATGFQNALLLYKKIKEYKMPSSIFYFYEILHCCRDCPIGDVSSFISVLKRLGVKNVDQLSEEKKTEEDIFTETEHDQSPELAVQYPNILSDSPTLGCLNSIKNIKTPQDRLFLLGGVQAVFDEMARQNVKPDNAIVSYLLQCSPSTSDAEMNLLQLAEKLDIAFNCRLLNDIALRRVRRKQYKEAKEVLLKMESLALKPNIITFGILSMTCVEYEDAIELLKHMSGCGVEPDSIIMNSLLVNACRGYQMEYVDMILDLIDSEKIDLQPRFLKRIEQFYSRCSIILKTQSKSFTAEKVNAMRKFCVKYRKWRDTTQTKYVQDDGTSINK